MGKMMRSLLASAEGYNHRKGRNSSPSVATAPPAVISSLPLGSTDGTGALLSGAITGMGANTQWQSVADYTSTLQPVAPKSYGIRGSRIVTNYIKSSTNINLGQYTISGGTIIDDKTFNINNISFPANLAQSLNGILTAGKQYTFSCDVYTDEGTKNFKLTRTDGASWSGATTSAVFVATTVPQKFSVTFTHTGTISDMLIGSEGLNNFFCSLGNYFVENLKVEEGAVVNPEVIVTQNDPVTVCYDTAHDGSPLRPSYVFDQTKRYSVFRPTELARSMSWTVGNCIEAMASDNIFRYYTAEAILALYDDFVGAAGTIGGRTPSPVSGSTSWTLRTGTMDLDGNGNVLCSNPAHSVATVDYPNLDVTFVSRTAATAGGGAGVMVRHTGTAGFLIVPGTTQMSLYEHVLPGTVYVIEYFPMSAADGEVGDLKIEMNGDMLFIYWNDVLIGSRLLTKYLTATGIGLFGVYIASPSLVSERFTVLSRSATTGTTGATSPTFPSSGTVPDGEILWNTTGYATLKGLEFAPSGSPKHPDGVVAQLDIANVLSDNQLVCMDFFPDSPENKPIFQQAATCVMRWVTQQITWLVGAQTRAGNLGKAASRFTRSIARMNPTNSILYNDGAMFTGASGGPVAPTGVFLGDPAAATQLTGCILNFCVLTNSSLNDTNAIARTRFDLKPDVALNADGVFLTQV